MIISQMRDDTTQDEEQLPLPLAGKQRATPFKKRSKPTPPLSRSWRGVLLSLSGMLLPLTGGFLSGWPWYRFGYEGDFLPSYVFLWVILSVVVGAILLRSWRAVLIVPIIFTAGDVLTGNVLQQFLFGWDCTSLTDIPCPGAYSPGWPAVQAWLGSKLIWDGLAFNLIFLVPLCACAALGAWGGISLSNWLKKQRQQP